MPTQTTSVDAEHRPSLDSTASTVCAAGTRSGARTTRLQTVASARRRRWATATPAERWQPRSGQILADRYLLEEPLGSGGMGVVYAATDLNLQRKVAIKFLWQRADEEGAMARRFRREAALLARLSHPGVVRIVDFATTGDHGTFFVMERLDGEPLSSRIDRDGPLPIAEACARVRFLLSTMIFVHERGILHRDLKPENVFLTEGRHYGTRLLDFGLSREIFSKTARLTQPGSIVGTPSHLSPEIVLGGEHSIRTDTYSMGLLLYECIAGRLPMDLSGRGFCVVLARVAKAPRRPLRELRPDVPADVAEVVDRSVRWGGEGFETPLAFRSALDAAASSMLKRARSPQSPV